MLRRTHRLCPLAVALVGVLAVPVRPAYADAGAVRVAPAASPRSASSTPPPPSRKKPKRYRFDVWASFMGMVAFDVERDERSSGMGAEVGFAVRVKVSERVGIAPVFYGGGIDNIRIDFYESLLIYAMTGVRVDITLGRHATIYPLLYLGVVLGGNSDGTPIVAVASEFGVGFLARIWRWFGIAVEARLSLIFKAPNLKFLVGPTLSFDF